MRWLAVLLAAWALPLQARLIDSHTDVRVARNGDITVVERVTLQVDARHPHAVLLRDVAAEAQVLEVTRNGRPEPWQLEGARLRIGARGKPLEFGRHVYKIAYRASGQVRFLDYMDEVRWTLPEAERVTIEVTLPAPVPARDLRLAAEGARFRSFVRDGAAAFRAEKGPLSITVRFPKGVVQSPGWFGGG